MENLIKTLLYEWKERQLPEVKPRENDLTKYLNQKTSKIVAVTGFRRVGKTYLVFDLIKKLLNDKDREQVVYINFEDERIPAQKDFLSKLLPTAEQTFEKNIEYLFLDEVQNIPDWSKWLRRIHDQTNIKIFVTGSSSKLSSREIPTELRGRNLEEKVFPLSFKEYLNFKDVSLDLNSIPYSSTQKNKVLKNLDQYLREGGLPEVVLEEPPLRREIIQQYYRSVVNRDVVERFNVKNEKALEEILLLLLNSKMYSISKLYKNLKSSQTKIGKETIAKYISHIEASYFLYSLPIFSYKIKDQMQYPRKTYFIDNGFLTALSTDFSPNWGKLYENLVFTHLLKDNKEKEVFYWQNQQKEEVDFIIKEKTRIKKLIQVCYNIENEETKEREIKALLKAKRQLQSGNMVIITKDYEDQEKHKDNKIEFIPLYKWLLS